jgi:methyltransferase family protein
LTLSSRIKHLINGPLAKFNFQLTTLTASKLERERIKKLADSGYFDKPVFPLLNTFSSFDGKLFIDGYPAYRDDCDRLLTYQGDPLRYNPANEYFSPADACAAYLIARMFEPATWFEVGSGNSTRVVRQAIDDGKLPTKLICVDPCPRIEISSIADELIRSEVESLAPQTVVERLRCNDVLFIDSSHELRAGGDVLHLLLNVVPKLRPGVLVHIHDVFLPYDYPRSWVEERTWDEQYVVQAMLQFGPRLQVVWPGHYVQKSRPEISSSLVFLGRGTAQSLWLRVSASDD